MLPFIDSMKLNGLCTKLMDGHIKYGFGSKAALTVAPESIKAIDCSGFVRYLLFHASSERIKMPDGSWIQNDWCKKQKFAEVDYEDASCQDNLLRIAFLPPAKGHAGHVWLIHGGKTMESHGGVGPSRRSWNTPVLYKGVTDCYELAIVPIVGDFVMPTTIVA